MARNEILIKAILIQNLTYREAAKRYDVSPALIHRLVTRYKTIGEEAYTPQSTRPKTCPNKTPETIQNQILTLRQELTSDGLDAGADTIQAHLALTGTHISRSTIWRILKRENLVTAQPQKRPKISFIRFQADRPNETWQSDVTFWQLPDGNIAEIIAWLDDHSRYVLHLTAHRRASGKTVTDTFRETAATYGYPASTLTDNGNIYTTRFSGGRGGQNAFETLLALEGIKQKNGRPYKPTTQGKIERFWRTLKQYLTKHDPKNLAEVTKLLDQFRNYYNQERPHRSLNRATPAFAYNLIPKALPGTGPDQEYWRIRYDKVDGYGKVSLRWNNQMLHLGVGNRNNRKPVIMMQHGLEVTVIDHEGEVLGEYEIDPKQNYQPKK